MPRFFPNPPEEPDKKRKLYTGQGREIIAFGDEENPDIVYAYFKKGDFFSHEPRALNKLYQILISHQILNLLFPQHFPKWLDAGINKDGYVASSRERIKGEINRSLQSKQLAILIKKFRNFGLFLSLDLARVNVFYDNGIEKYVDSVDPIVRGNTDIDRLVKLLERENFSKEKIGRVVKLCKRIIVLQKIN